MPTTTIQDVDPRAAITLKELADIESIAGKHITFSLTLACPNACEHCIVKSGPDMGRFTMTLEDARRYGSQMHELYRQGIRYISFTGGEPVLAPGQLGIISRAAKDAGMECSMVTSAFWAENAERAETMIKTYPHIDNWDISCDAFHEKYVPLEKIQMAFTQLQKWGKKVTIRFTYQEQLSESDLRILNRIIILFGKKHISMQKLRNEGRGRDVCISGEKNYNIWLKPCVTQGLVVRYDGSIGCCCLNLVEERNHPFQFGNARTRSLCDIYTDFMCFPLLQLMRVIGFSELMHWLEESDVHDELAEPLPNDVCDLCPLLFTNRTIADLLKIRANIPENQMKIALLASKILGEPMMLKRVVEEFRYRSDSLEGFLLAESLASGKSTDCDTDS